MSDLNAVQEKLLSNIEKYGLEVMHILEDKTGPGFSYSVGLFESYQHPEIIIVGLKQELCHTLINNMANDIKSGEKYMALNYYSNILNNFQCYFVDVDHSNYDKYVGQAQAYYGNDNFPLIQCIYPTVKGIFPWEKEWPDDIKNLQPILGVINNPN